MASFLSGVAIMVINPVEIGADGCQTQKDFIIANQGSLVFFVRNAPSKYLAHAKVAKVVTNENFYSNSRLQVYFSIIQYYGDGMHYYISSEPNHEVNIEQFIDFVSANYPDHFEWILFHPEWLNNQRAS